MKEVSTSVILGSTPRDSAHKSVGSNSLPSDDDDFDLPYDEGAYGSYDQMRGNFKNIVVESKYINKINLMQIQVRDLPCPREEPVTDAPQNYIITPAYAEINYENCCTAIEAILSVILLSFLMCLKVSY